jgi:hypothetical protein
MTDGEKGQRLRGRYGLGLLAVTEPSSSEAQI